MDLLGGAIAAIQWRDPSSGGANGWSWFIKVRKPALKLYNTNKCFPYKIGKKFPIFAF